MYTSVRRYQLEPKNVPEVVAAIERDFVPLVTHAKGFVSYSVVPQGDRLATVSVFRDKEGADESTRLAKEFVAKELSALMPQPPEIIAGEDAVERHA